MKGLKTKKLISILIVLVMSLAIMASCSTGTPTDQSPTSTPAPVATDAANDDPTAIPLEEAEITFLSVWNGGGGGFPQDQINNPVAQKIKELTGITVKLESITTNEAEKLNTMFASGVMPDFMNAPFWSSTGGEGKIITKAASEGQLLDLTPYLDQYPNVKKLYEIGVAKDFAEFDLGNPDFGGKTYIIPQQTPGDNEADVTNWAYGVYARGDILKKLGVNPADVNTSDKVYDLLVQIKEGNFVDTTGRPVIPAGTWHNGWSYGEFLGSWSDYTISDYREENGEVINWMFSKDQEEKLIFMRKLFKDGLFDLEAFSNTDTMAKEKMAVGKIALFGAQSGMDHFKATLYSTNPEMKYELLGPMINKSGNIKTQVEKKGRSGFPAMFLSATTENADAVLRFLDFANSEQGWLLAQWGVEGVHYTIEDGQPKWIPEMKERLDNEVNFKRDQGIGFMGGFIGADSRPSLWPIPEEDKTQFDKWQDEYKAKLPVQFIDKVSANYLQNDWAGLQEYRDTISTLDYEQEFRKAIFAATDEEAISILEDIKQKYIDAGIKDLSAHVAEKASARSDIGW